MNPQFSTRDFAPVMAMLYAASGGGREPDKYTLKVYYDLLNDLPLEAVQIAAKRAVSESKFPTLPPVGVLRALACEAIEPEACGAVEAWGAVRQAVKRFGYVRPVEGLGSLPPDAAAVARAIGWQELCDSDNPAATRAHFLRMFEEYSNREQKQRRLPESVREAQRRLRPPEESKRLAERIGIPKWIKDDIDNSKPE